MFEENKLNSSTILDCFGEIKDQITEIRPEQRLFQGKVKHLENKINATIIGEMSYQLTIKCLTLISVCYRES